MRIPSFIFSLFVGALIFGAANSGSTQDRVDGPSLQAGVAQADTTSNQVAQSGVWVSWRDPSSGCTTSRRFQCSQGEAASVAEIVDYLNQAATCSGVTIWMETLAPDLLPILSTMENLESLTIVGSTFRAGSLRNLRQCSGLKSVCLDGCVVSDTTCSELSEIRSLEYVQLAGSAVTNRGLRHLGRIRTLKELDLRGTLVSDDGLSLLENNQALRLLDVRGTAVTPNGAHRLTKTLQNLRIHFRPVNRLSLQLVAR